jgi:hypothetical protein
MSDESGKYNTKSIPQHPLSGAAAFLVDPQAAAASAVTGHDPSKHTTYYPSRALLTLSPLTHFLRLSYDSAYV